MFNVSNGFIQLERSFHELAKNARESDTFDLNEAFTVGPRLQWDDLLKGYRTVILSEAGTGKTEEIRQTAKCLRAEGKQAFFMRLEHISSDFEDAFEVGTFEEFTEWLAAADEGWLLLDSVDEARLRNPGDFELAIRKLGRRIQTASARAHIFVTGRTSAWRARTDFELCERHLPFATEITRLVPHAPSKDERPLDDFSDAEAFDIEESEEKSSAFRIVTLDDLSMSQIKVFSQARGVIDAQAFLEEIERADAGSFTTRPQDLEELVDFWTKERRIGTRLELMRNSVQRRLEERDQNHRDAQPLPGARIREGVRLLAAASVLGKTPTIQVPDGSHNNKGIPVRVILSDWNDHDQQILLSRPIFDEAIYGTVRFHHRSVREFLAAEWLAQLLERSTSRRQVEALLFRMQYGVEVVVPTMRPVLPWLAILDDRICSRILRIAPEVLFEGGDPSALPFATRKATLVEVCKELASGKSGRSALEYAAVQRFANPDLSEDIRALLKTYASNTELVSFLVRMVWLGRLDALKDEVKALALSPTTAQYTREASIRALRAVGTTRDIDDLRVGFLQEVAVLKRDWLGEVVNASSPTPKTVTWLLEALAKAAPKKRFTVDTLTDAVTTFVESIPMALLPKLAEGFNFLLEEPPFIERGYCDVSKRNSWLLTPASIAMERLIQARRPEATGKDVLGILYKLRTVGHWDHDLRDVKVDLHKLIRGWTDLNRATFWNDVRTTRQSAFYVKQKLRLTSCWQVSWLAHWDFGAGDFDYAVDAIRASYHQDDKMVALTLAFDIYSKNDRPPIWEGRLRKVVSGDMELEKRLELLLDPPESEHDREEKKWKRRVAAQERLERSNRAKSKDFIVSNIEQISSPALEDPTGISDAQWYLHERLREKSERANRWTVGRWRELIPEFGEDVAQAYRKGVTQYWRKYRPVLRSEGAPANSTPISVIFGLSGLDIEALETPNWPSELSQDEVALACRYAAYELNGFPPWFPKLFDTFPEIVGDFLLSEIRKEISSEKPNEETNYLLSDVSWFGQWAWDRIALTTLDILQTANVGNVFNLGKLLTIVQGSDTVSDQDLAKLAQIKVQGSASAELTATWFAVWTGVDPEKAIPHIAAHLSSIVAPADQTEFAMNFVTRLLGGRRSGSGNVRQKYVTPTHLKDLYLLMQGYVREDEDINRSGGGVYSPGLRDNAQDARNALFNQLKQIPGKEAFVALCEIATKHPKAASRPWLTSFARSKAEQDADSAPWLPAQVRDFHQHLDRTPTNHRELADLAIMRLLDLQDDLENGDDSVARVLQRVEEETEMRNYLAHELREMARGRYTITQEEELADAKRPDLRFHGAGFDAPVPSELKLAERWSGPQLFERLEVQLSGDYLRDNRSARGIFVLVSRTKGRRWQVPSGELVEFDKLLEALRNHWNAISGNHPHVEDLVVVGIDLSKRT